MIGAVGGTFIYALHLHGSVVFVGQCADIQKQIDVHARNKDLQFDRFTYNFLEGVLPGTDAANTMEAIAIVKLRPLLNKCLPETENYCTELQSFCTRYNNLAGISYPIPYRLMEDIVKSQQLMPLYATGDRKYYRISDLNALVSVENALLQLTPVAALADGGQAA